MQNQGDTAIVLSAYREARIESDLGLPSPNVVAKCGHVSRSKNSSEQIGGRQEVYRSSVRQWEYHLSAIERHCRVCSVSTLGARRPLIGFWSGEKTIGLEDWCVWSRLGGHKALWMPVLTQSCVSKFLHQTFEEGAKCSFPRNPFISLHMLAQHRSMRLQVS